MEYKWVIDTPIGESKVLTASEAIKCAETFIENGVCFKITRKD